MCNLDTFTVSLWLLCSWSNIGLLFQYAFFFSYILTTYSNCRKQLCFIFSTFSFSRWKKAKLHLFSTLLWSVQLFSLPNSTWMFFMTNTFSWVSVKIVGSNLMITINFLACWIPVLGIVKISHCWLGSPSVRIQGKHLWLWFVPLEKQAG